jgi:hypothetical protein
VSREQTKHDPLEITTNIPEDLKPWRQWLIWRRKIRVPETLDALNRGVG